MRIISILGIVILAIISTTAKAQVVNRPLPQLIQNLSNEDYFIWAQWQNRQATRRAEEFAEDTSWLKYNYANRVVNNSFSRGNTTARISGTSNSISNSSTRSGNGWSNQSGSRSITQNRLAHMNTSRFGGTTTTSYQVRYINPDYVGPGIITIYNPWARPEKGLGTPDWKNLFIPCEKSTITMQEVLDRLMGPQSPEKVFKIMMEGYFGD